MHSHSKILISVLFGMFFLSMSSALAFSFNFGDDDDDWWRYAYWGYPNQAWVGPNGMVFYPRLPYFERNRLLDRRQHSMRQRYNAMDELGAMLYGNRGFDRAKAISLARKIEGMSARHLSDDFHPGSIATNRSRTTLMIWRNRAAFDANAKKLETAVRALAEEFEKQPVASEQAVLLRGPLEKRGDSEMLQISVSPRVWEKFNDLSAVCDSCHFSYRGYDW